VRLNFVFEYPEALLDWEIEGFEAVPVAFGTDVPRLKQELCRNRVLYGPGSILVAHGPDEYIRVPELIESIAGYKRLVMHFLR
jgi:acetylornithine deacetylase